MAVTAFQPSMLTFQFEISEVVIKSEFIEFDDISIASFMIRMAYPAFLPAYLFVSAMVARFILYIFGNVLVACHAKLCLLSFIKLVMAFAAFIFVFGMALDHFARAEQ
jgi:hypothetical protein